MFRTVPLSITMSFSLYTQQWYISYRFADSLRAGSGWNWFSTSFSKLVWYITLLCVEWKTPDDGQKNCPKHVEFYFKNKFKKLVHLVGFVIRNQTVAYVQHTNKAHTTRTRSLEPCLWQWDEPREVELRTNAEEHCDLYTRTIFCIHLPLHYNVHGNSVLSLCSWTPIFDI
jgi:hypothetical protein